MTRKYEFTNERHPLIPALRRIRALIDIPEAEVHAGDLGGWIEHEGNLSQDGSAWVYGSARVAQPDHVLTATVMGSGLFEATLFRTDDGHQLTVGCWEGTVPEFRTMIESDTWVEADARTRELRRPELLVFAALCEARIASWGVQA